MENFNGKSYRDNLANNLKEIRKDDPESARIILSHAQDSEEYQFAKENEKQNWTPVEKINFIEYTGSELIKSAQQIKAMMEIAKDRKINIDYTKSDILNKFDVLNQNEVLMQNLLSDAGWITSFIAEQGVLVTPSELLEKIEEMKLNK